jgi:hypothetical protein
VRPPHRWVRRLVVAPLVLALALALVVSAPVWLLVLTVLSPVLPGRLRPLRVLWMAAVYLFVEATLLIVLGGLWLLAGCGVFVRRPTFQRWHYQLCGSALRLLYQQARWALNVDVVVDGAQPAGLPVDVPLLVLCRHAGPGDSFLIAHALINWYDRDPRIVLGKGSGRQRRTGDLP